MREPDRTRIFDAINHIERDDIPLLEIDPDMALVKEILGKNLPMNIHPFEMEAEDNVELNLRMGNDMVYFSHVWRVGRKEKPDKDGRLHYADGTIKTRSDFSKIWFPDIGELERRLENTIKCVEGTGMGIMLGTQTAAFTSMTAMGYQDFLLNCAIDPDLVKDMIKAIHEYCMEEMEILMKYPVDMVKIASGLVNQIGPMVPFEQLDELETSFLREQSQLIKRKDKYLFFHIDGKVDHFIPEYVAMGVDVLNPIDPSGGTQNIFEIKDQYGDLITLCGNINIDTVLKDGSPDEIFEEVSRYITTLGKGGGYIVASSHNLHQLVPLENFYAMRDAVHKYKHIIQTDR